eukprot:CAMPEP_0184302320 /NCGR_PEP_ID=MMETSP1049-20130417/12318_1 /TAXON_ID=77928 /ORGANISM="Proteomonas sulcata, Strain CCMP704" /LENGTH=340 /DNA_ID=CAMNT_0026613583 /DNA_START=345 /DNA_END=1367 /DNA_ORIENTATION=-
MTGNEIRQQGATTANQAQAESLTFMQHSEFLQSAKVHLRRTSDGPAKPESKIISLADLARHFNMPQHRACEALGICTTSMKKLCKKFGLKRWPYSSLSSAQPYVQEWQAKAAAFFGSEYSQDLRAHQCVSPLSLTSTTSSPNEDVSTPESQDAVRLHRASSAPMALQTQTAHAKPVMVKHKVEQTCNPTAASSMQLDFNEMKVEHAANNLPSPSVVHPLASGSSSGWTFGNWEGSSSAEFQFAQPQERNNKYASDYKVPVHSYTISGPYNLHPGNSVKQEEQEGWICSLDSSAVEQFVSEPLELDGCGEPDPFTDAGLSGMGSYGGFPWAAPAERLSGPF